MFNKLRPADRSILRKVAVLAIGAAALAPGAHAIIDEAIDTPRPTEPVRALTVDPSDLADRQVREWREEFNRMNTDIQLQMQDKPEGVKQGIADRWLSTLEHQPSIIMRYKIVDVPDSYIGAKIAADNASADEKMHAAASFMLGADKDWPHGLIYEIAVGVGEKTRPASGETAMDQIKKQYIAEVFEGAVTELTNAMQLAVTPKPALKRGNIPLMNR